METDIESMCFVEGRCRSEQETLVEAEDSKGRERLFK